MVFIQTISKGLVPLSIVPGCSVKALERKIEELGLAPVDCQRLIFNGKQLSRDSLTSEGGAKKRKKKTYNTAKKIKHKRKKVKLAVLKLFSTEGDCLRSLRRQCDRETCRYGVFLADHGDRHYCGRCGITYVYPKGSGENTA